jgi:hypothetical protein
MGGLMDIDTTHVHRHTIDHIKSDTPYQKFNKRVALLITKNVGTMTCFWIFGAIALISLPFVLASGSVLLIIAWLTQSFIQLVLLPAIIVGQNLQTVANDVRSDKEFQDTETIVDRLDTKTEGGIKEILDAIDELKPKKKRLVRRRK